MICSPVAERRWHDMTLPPADSNKIFVSIQRESSFGFNQNVDFPEINFKLSFSVMCVVWDVIYDKIRC